MDRAETHLRLVAEAELRRAREQDASVPVGGRVVRIAEALTAVGAIDAATAAGIQADFELALSVRPSAPGPAVRRRQQGILAVQGHRRLGDHAREAAPVRP